MRERKKQARSTSSLPFAGMPLAFERRNGLRGNGLASPHGAHAFVRLGLQVDARRLDAQRAGQRLPHRGKMRAEFWPLRDDDGVQVRDAQLSFGKKRAHVLEKKKAVGILPFWIGVGKMRGVVAESRGAQQRVADGVRKSIAIGMADGTLLEKALRRRRGSACARRKAGGGHGRCRRDSLLASAGLVLLCGAFLSQIELREFEIARPRDLQIALGTEYHINGMPKALDQPRFIRGSGAVNGGTREGFPEKRGVEDLWRLGELAIGVLAEWSQ